MTCIPSGRNSRGSQNVKVFPEPVPEMHTVSLSPRNCASVALHCQRQGRRPKTSSPFCLISATVGRRREGAGNPGDTDAIALKSGALVVGMGTKRGRFRASALRAPLFVNV